MDKSFLDFTISGVLALIMFGIGVSISWDQVSILFRRPKAVLIAHISQIVFLPMLAFLVAWFFPVPNTVKVGLVILAASPGGATSGFITYLMRGNAALSIILTSINSIITLFTIPILVNLAIGVFLNQEERDFTLPFWSTVYEIFLITIIPATLGIVLRQLRESLAESLNRYLRPLLIVSLGVVFGLKILGNEAQGETGLTWSDIQTVLPATLVLNLLCLLVGYFWSRSNGLYHRENITIGIESGVHNTTLAFLIAGSMLKNPQFAIPALIYSMFSFWTALLFAYWANRQEKTRLTIERKGLWRRVLLRKRKK